MKKLILLMSMAAILSAKQPVAIPQNWQLYPGVTGDQMYGVMVRNVADFNISLVVKEACLVKFTSHRVLPGPVFYWTVRCDSGQTGALISVNVMQGLGGTGFLKMDREDQLYVAGVIDAMWKRIQFDLCKTDCDKSPVASK